MGGVVEGALCGSQLVGTSEKINFALYQARPGSDVAAPSACVSLLFLPGRSQTSQGVGTN